MALRYRVPDGDDLTEPAVIYTVAELGPEHLNLSDEFRCVIWFATVRVFVESIVNANVT